MQKTAVIVHGSFGHPQENWFPWLKTELEGLGYTTYVPAFPTPEDQSFDAWYKVFEEVVSLLNEESILIGHSTGAIFIPGILQELPVKVKAVFLVSPFMEKLGLEHGDQLNHSFIIQPFDWVKIKQNAETFAVYYSNNDPYVPADVSRKVADVLGAHEHEILGAGHFNTNAGYTEFPKLLKDIKLSPPRRRRSGIRPFKLKPDLRLRGDDSI